MEKIWMAFGHMNAWDAAYVVCLVLLLLIWLLAYALKNAQVDPEECECTPEHVTIPEALVKHHSMTEREQMRKVKVDSMTDLEKEAARSDFAMWADIEERAMNTDPEAY